MLVGGTAHSGGPLGVGGSAQFSPIGVSPCGHAVGVPTQIFRPEL